MTRDHGFGTNNPFTNFILLSNLQNCSQSTLIEGPFTTILQLSEKGMLQRQKPIGSDLMGFGSSLEPLNVWKMRHYNLPQFRKKILWGIMPWTPFQGFLNWWSSSWTPPFLWFSYWPSLFTLKASNLDQGTMQKILSSVCVLEGINFSFEVGVEACCRPHWFLKSHIEGYTLHVLL